MVCARTTYRLCGPRQFGTDRITRDRTGLACTIRMYTVIPIVTYRTDSYEMASLTQPFAIQATSSLGTGEGEPLVNPLRSSGPVSRNSHHIHRICPGQAFAEAQMFDIIAKVLHVFDITPPLDEAGNPIRIEPRVTGSSLL